MLTDSFSQQRGVQCDPKAKALIAELYAISNETLYPHNYQSLTDRIWKALEALAVFYRDGHKPLCEFGALKVSGEELNQMFGVQCKEFWCDVHHVFPIVYLRMEHTVYPISRQSAERIYRRLGEAIGLGIPPASPETPAPDARHSGSAEPHAPEAPAPATSGTP